MSCKRILRTLFPLAWLMLTWPFVTPARFAQDPQTQPDNTKRNKEKDPNADQQKMNPADRETTQKIRKAIMDDKTLSTYAHNIKIITRNGKVTLRGPVRKMTKSTPSKRKPLMLPASKTSPEVAPPKS